MGILANAKIDVDREYKKLADVANITFEDGKTYAFQVRKGVFLASSSSKPEIDGFIVATPEPFTFTKVAGEDLWVKTAWGVPARIVISE